MLNDKKVKTRKVYDKPANVQCKECAIEGKFIEISLYALSSHIKFNHAIGVEGYVQKHGEFRKQKQKKGIRNIQTVQCKICNESYSMVGIATHFLDTHNITVAEYIKQYGEYRPKYLNYEKRAKESNNFKCKLPGCKFSGASERHLSFHIKLEHNKTKEEYIINDVFGGILPKCKCGCDGDVSINIHEQPYHNDFIKGHGAKGENNGMYGKKHTAETIKKIFSHKNMTRCEKKFAELLDNNNIEYHFQYFIHTGEIIKSYDFKIKGKSIIIEIDGDYWHGNPEFKKHFHGVEQTRRNDEFKTRLAESHGFKVYRFWENDVMNDNEKIKEFISSIK